MESLFLTFSLSGDTSQGIIGHVQILENGSRISMREDTFHIIQVTKKINIKICLIVFTETMERVAETERDKMWDLVWIHNSVWNNEIKLILLLMNDLFTQITKMQSVTNLEGKIGNQI